MSQGGEQQKLDRKAASKYLKVSVRTLDRYIKAKRLSTYIVDGRIWLNKKELEEFKKVKNEVATVDKVSMSTPGPSIDDYVDIVDNSESSSQEYVDTVSTKTRKEDFLENKTVYKKLYVELKEELKEKQERLEIANYRVGQLEAQLKSSVPMLEYHRETYENKKKKEHLQQEIEKQILLIKDVKNHLKYERFNKRIFLIILLIILSLQPLWLLFIYK